MKHIVCIMQFYFIIVTNNGEHILSATLCSQAEEAERAIQLKEEELRELHERQREPVVVEPVEVQLQTMEVAVSIENKLGPYYKSKLELKSNFCEILPVNCKFICVHIFLFAMKVSWNSNLSFVSLSWSKITDKLAFI